MEYTEHDLYKGVSYIWNNAHIEYSHHTKRGTLLEMIRRPKWGVACYMDSCVQSCEIDEAMYHEGLVQPLFSEVDIVPRTACILGGGEGATAREVLKCPTIEYVKMIEWDHEVVDIFRNMYPQWAQGAWDDKRLVIEYDDAFTVCQQERTFDIVVVDLFDPNESDFHSWAFLIECVAGWAQKGISIYCGMNDIFSSGPDTIVHRTKKLLETIGFTYVDIQKKYIPSFNGEALFVIGFRT